MKRGQSKSAAKISALEKELRDLRQLIEGKKKSSSPAPTTAKKKASKKTAKKKIAKKVNKKVSKK
jgi:hypothetical protein